MEVHAEAERYDGGLQEKFRQALALDVKWVNEAQSVREAGQKRDRRRDQATCSYDKAYEEEILFHISRVPRRVQAVQAAILINN